MKSPAHTLALYLESQAIGTFGGNSGWVISVSDEPETPDDTVTVYDTPGRQPLLYSGVYRPEVQVRVRSGMYTDAWDKMEVIRTIFHAMTDSVVQGSHIVGVWMTSDIQSLGRDDNGRYRLTANYSITLSEV